MRQEWVLSKAASLSYSMAPFYIYLTKYLWQNQIGPPPWPPVGISRKSLVKGERFIRYVWKATKETEETEEINNQTSDLHSA